MSAPTATSPTAGQQYVTASIRSAMLKLIKQSTDMIASYSRDEQKLYQTSFPSRDTTKIGFVTNMQHIEKDMHRSQQETSINIAKERMAVLCKQIIAIVARQYTEHSAAAAFKLRMEALQYACYIQKRYRYAPHDQKNDFAANLMRMMKDAGIVGYLSGNRDTFPAELSASIGIMLGVIKTDLPKDCAYGVELVDQIAAISSFDGGTAEIQSHNYNINIQMKKSTQLRPFPSPAGDKSAPPRQDGLLHII